MEKIRLLNFIKFLKIFVFILGFVFIAAVENISAADDFSSADFSEENSEIADSEFVTIEKNDKPEVKEKLFSDEVVKVILISIMLIAASILTFFRIFKYRKVFLVLSLLIFGFYMGGCNCTIGAFLKTITGLSLVTVNLLLWIIPAISTFFSGRIFCGWVCPVGAMQELLFDEKHYKEIKPEIEKFTKFVKYPVIAVILLTAFLTDNFIGEYFMPFKAVFNLNGNYIFIGISVVWLLLSIFIYRPFCRIICPYAVLITWISKLSPFKRNCTFDCTSCGVCTKKCKINAIDNGKIEKGECIVCGDCYDCCPQNKIVKKISK